MQYKTYLQIIWNFSVVNANMQISMVQIFFHRLKLHASVMVCWIIPCSLLLGSLGGLHLIINAEQYDYVYTDIGFGSEAGFFISIHDPDVPEMKPVANAYFAPVGFATRISMQKEKVGI